MMGCLQSKFEPITVMFSEASVSDSVHRGEGVQGGRYSPQNRKSRRYAFCWNTFLLKIILYHMVRQGGHGTGKTEFGSFSRQGKHREFCFDTGKNFETQGKYFSVTQGKI